MSLEKQANFLTAFPPANVSIWDTFGDISCNVALGKGLKEEAEFPSTSWRRWSEKLICNANLI